MQCICITNMHKSRIPEHQVNPIRSLMITHLALKNNNLVEPNDCYPSQPYGCCFYSIFFLYFLVKYRITRFCKKVYFWYFSQFLKFFLKIGSSDTKIGQAVTKEVGKIHKLNITQLIITEEISSLKTSNINDCVNSYNNY